MSSGQEYKRKLLDVCTKRNDGFGNTVRDRILGAGMSDLHAVDARYHRKCGKLFHAIPASKGHSSVGSGFECVQEKAFTETLGALENDTVLM